MRKIAKRIIAIIIILVMIAVLVVPVFADEPKGNVFICNRKIVNFGTVPLGKDIRPQILTIQSNLSSVVSMAWKLLDPYGIFSVEFMQSPQAIQPSGTIEIIVKIRDATRLGYYNGLLVCYDKSNVSNYVSIPLYATFSETTANKISNISIISSTSTMSPNSHALLSVIDDTYTSYTDAVTWTLKGQSSPQTYISANGDVYVAPDEKSQVLHVNVQSTTNEKITASIDIKLVSNTYTVSAGSLPIEGGVVKGSGIYYKGFSAILEAVPFPGFVFNYWVDADNQRHYDRVITLDNIEESTDFTAVFDFSYPSMTAIPINTKYGRVLMNMQTKDNLSVTAYSNSNYTFDCWCDNRYVVSKSNAYDITDNVNITAFYTKTEPYAFAYSFPEEGGTVDIKVSNNIATIEVTKNKGYVFDGLYINDVLISTEPICETELQGDTCVIAKYHPKDAPQIDVFSGNYGCYISTTTFCPGIMSLVCAVPYKDYYIAGSYCDYIQQLSNTFVCNPTSSVVFISNVITDPVLNTKQFDQILDEDSLSKQQEVLDNAEVTLKSDLGVLEHKLNTLPYTVPDTSGILAFLGLNVDDVANVIDEQSDTEYIKLAYMYNYLHVSSNFTNITNASFDDVAELVQCLLTPEERLKLFMGDQVMLYLSLLPNDYMAFDLGPEYTNYAISSQYKAYLTKIVNGYITFIDVCNLPINLQISTPAKYDYKVFSNYKGAVDLLPDTDNIDNVYTISTKYMCDYALAYKTSDNVAVSPKHDIKATLRNFFSLDHLNFEYVPIVFILALFLFFSKSK